MFGFNSVVLCWYVGHSSIGLGRTGKVSEDLSMERCVHRKWHPKPVKGFPEMQIIEYIFLDLTVGLGICIFSTFGWWTFVWVVSKNLVFVCALKSWRDLSRHDCIFSLIWKLVWCVCWQIDSMKGKVWEESHPSRVRGFLSQESSRTWPYYLLLNN